jgi:hypothetical protein
MDTIHTTIKESLRSQKKIFQALLVFLTNCSSSSPWNLSYLKGSQQAFDSVRLSYPVHDVVNQVAIEMIYANNSLRTYLVVYSHPIPPYLGNPQEAVVTLKTEAKVYRAIAYRHQGGQRIGLPSDLQQTLIDALLNENSVTLELQKYSTTLHPKQFIAAYHQLYKAPLNLPVQFPFKL